MTRTNGVRRAASPKKRRPRNRKHTSSTTTRESLLFCGDPRKLQRDNMAARPRRARSDTSRPSKNYARYQDISMKKPG
ncbi:hypothetical protein [Pandoravirus japonicus]|uniref:Uncharacterized protein n=1 Tax=Pandoravirus japonicus TaxID=2823154 RepID=A0A811BS21_9VIRU|nr:hypothetical protein [Pandoravirus japonicus]BCU03151.1 hypothetical protein [Pandoravirus japonicus]